MNRHLHIVCLDMPSPPDYGGAIDMLCRIRALHQQGIKIHLHYFDYHPRGAADELKDICASVHVYERRTGKKGLSSRLPYIVASRMDPRLLENLQADAHPVLLEGVHCTGYLEQLVQNGRKVVVRLHNDEAAYYRQLAGAERNWWKKFFFRRESRLLQRYQRQLSKLAYYACITQSDAALFRNEYGLPNSFFLPAFIPWQEVTGPEGLGSFCFYHGNLSVPENEKAAIWLLENVFSRIKVPFVLAGKNPSRRLDKLAHLYQHTCLVANPGEAEMNDLIRKAHIHLLPSFSDTGIKFKLLHALYEGRHCVANENMVKGTGLEAACHIGSNAEAFAAIIMQLHHHPFGEEEVRLRKELLGNTYDAERNARTLIQYLW